MGAFIAWIGQLFKPRSSGSAESPTRFDPATQERETLAESNCSIRAEVRVHGVSATPPEVMLASPILQTPSPVRVAGDALSGFYHREYPYKRLWDRVEAFSWGGLTSGGGLRALWLLLTPFLLANVAFWTSPVPLDESTKGRRWFLRVASGVVQRLFALSLTATFVLGLVIAAMDVVGLQYVRTFLKGTTEASNSQGRVAWLSFLDWSPLAHPNLQLLATALIPIASVLLLWRLGYSTWRTLESAHGKRVDPVDIKTPLEDRRMWNGQGPVARLRAVHVTFALAIVAVSMLAPLVLRPNGDPILTSFSASPWGRAALIIGCILGALLVFVTGLAMLPSMTHRKPLSNEADEPEPIPLLYRCLPWITCALTIAAVVVLIGSGAAPPLARGLLPYIAPAIAILFVVQAGLLVVVSAITIGLYWAVPPEERHQQPRVQPVAEGTPSNSRPVWFGLTGVVLSTVGWLLAGAWSAALTIFAVTITGGTVVSSAALSTPNVDAIIVPAPMIWGVAATCVFAGVAIVVLAATGAAAWIVKLRLSRRVAQAYRRTEENAESGPNRKRFRYIRLNWLLGRAPDFVAWTVGALVVAMWAIVLTGIYLYVRDDDAVSKFKGAFLYPVGSFVVVGIGTLSLLAARVAFKDPEDRKKIGVLWDVGTFWPRATHPLAPPCYAERAVPDLLQRIEYYRGSPNIDGTIVNRGSIPVVLSCHSQGSIIGAAVILQLTYDQSSDLSFLTYGSPLRRLYARYFPAYFGPKTLCRVGALLSTRGDRRTVISADETDREHWRWRNLWRPTDPVGHPIFVDYHDFRERRDVDQQLRDPVRFGKAPGDPVAPAANDHSSYPLDPRYYRALKRLLGFEAAPLSGVAIPPSGPPVDQ